ncbi:hypothetical protein KBG31_00220 [Patescibacteria group bacterium]|nr:hypothetical protein [Patescibacteria group bacterium]
MVPTAVGFKGTSTLAERKYEGNPPASVADIKSREFMGDTNFPQGVTGNTLTLSGHASPRTPVSSALTLTATSTASANGSALSTNTFNRKRSWGVFPQYLVPTNRFSITPPPVILICQKNTAIVL